MSKPSFCRWKDELGICCNPFQDPPFSADCPPDITKCPGYGNNTKIRMTLRIMK
jgi:hypothetical protein